jgi:hypothetical protein
MRFFIVFLCLLLSSCAERNCGMSAIAAGAEGAVTGEYDAAPGALYVYLGCKATASADARYRDGYKVPQ